ncbi:MAG: CoA transferase [Acidimicrobiales bacterium]
MEPPLEGVRVLTVGPGVAAAYAARQFAGFGADVVHVELAEPSRLSDDQQVALLAGGRRVEIGPGQLGELGLAADVVIEDRPPGSLAELGLAPAQARAAKPALVVVSITPFGQSGPYSAWSAGNAVSFAMGGIMSLTGDPDRPPLLTGGEQALHLGGLHAFGAALCAYYGSLVWGEGDWVDLSLQECAAGMLELYAAGVAYGEAVPQRLGNHHRAVWGVYHCADGHAGVCCLERQTPALFACIGDPALDEERFRDPAQRLEHDDELTALIAGWVIERTRAELGALGAAHRVPFGAVESPLELLASPGLVERGFFDQLALAEGPAVVPGRPFPGFAWRSPPPLSARGADTTGVLADWLEARR